MPVQCSSFSADCSVGACGAQCIMHSLLNRKRFLMLVLGDRMRRGGGVGGGGGGRW